MKSATPAAYRFRDLGRFPKFIVVGAVATLVHFLTLTFLVQVVSMPWPTAASAIGCVAGIATSYYGNYAWTFVCSEPHRRVIGQFVGVYVLTMSVHTMLMYFQINFVRLDYVAAFVAATSFTTLMNFLLSKFAVFERKSLAISLLGRPGRND
jgi:putative flippase GtrA